MSLAVLASYDKTGKINKDELKNNLNKTEGINPKVEEVTWNLSVTVDGYIFKITQLGNITYVGKTDLPENTTQNPQEIGKEVALKEGWGTETVKYIKTADGTENTEVTKLATVYAVSVGNGETVPIPKGFYYVGGNLDTGVIISDNEEDRYDGKTDKTAHSYNTTLKGNQFVWIPCNINEYKKTNWGTTYRNANWNTNTQNAELAQIQKYGGFYIARYEAGLATNITETTKDQTHTQSNQTYNLSGTPQSRAAQIPWMFIDWTTANTNAQIMYNNEYVYSALTSGTQWDVLLNKLVEKTNLEETDLTNSASWGNHCNSSFEYKGRSAKLTKASGVWKIAPFGEEKTETTTEYKSSELGGELLTTGASDYTQRYNIYDLAGNLLEWTEEISTYATSGQYRIGRGGYMHMLGSPQSACYRDGDQTITYTSMFIGFRPVLYIK